MADRAVWLAIIESHWEAFKRAGWVVPVTYRAYDPDADTTAGTGVKRIDAVARGEQKREQATPDGGRVFVATRRIHLRVSDMGGVAATKRGIIELADGTEYLVESVEVAAEGTRYACDCVRL